MSLSNTVVFRAPHRFFFALGFAQFLFLMLFWSLELLARIGGNGLPWTDMLPARWLHGALFLFGPFPAWIFAFLLTAMPRWLKLPAVWPSAYLPAGLTMAAGWLLVDFSLLAGMRSVFFVGLGTVGAGWGMALLPIWKIARQAPKVDWHPRLVASSVSLGVPALWLSLWGMSSGVGERVAEGFALGIWFFLLPSLLIVAHRMLPFFTRSALPQSVPWQPMWILWALLGVLGVHGLATLLGDPGLAWPADLVGAALAFYLSWRWNLRAALAHRLLATHHLALLWLGVGLALAGLQSFSLLLGWNWGGLAALHALLFGFALSLVFGMATRVTLGHSGQPVTATPLVWRLFWVLQAAVLLRLSADLFPVLAVGVLPLAGVATLLLFGVWFSRYAAYWAIDADE